MKSYLYILLSILACSCKVPFQPPVINANANNLVVEGVINSSNSITDSTQILLSRTVNVDASITAKLETHAQVSIEDGQNFSVAFKETPGARYIAGPLGLDNKKKYRLRIKTSDNKIYLSDFVDVVYTPPIDSIGFYPYNTGVQIYVNTHNPANNTRYYRWMFSEVWKFETAHMSEFVTNGISIVPRTKAQLLPDTCWGSDVSSNILLGSSVKLTQDVIYQAPLNYIDGTSEKIEDRYRILVKQYALTKDAYEFWEELKKNTENVGSIFDAQPSANRSNIHCTTNPAETVLGYVTISNIESRLVYFNKKDLHILAVASSIVNCRLDSEYYVNPNTGVPEVQLNLVPFGSTLIPVKYFTAPWGAGYMAAELPCVDCSARGVTKKPSSWLDN